MKTHLACIALIFALAPAAAAQTYLGQLSANPYNPDSIANPYGAGSPYKADGVNNRYGVYGSPYSPKSATNPHATQPPKLYDAQGNYRGELSANRYAPDSISNFYGRYEDTKSIQSVDMEAIVQELVYGSGPVYSTG